jgi:hypothetical protein
VVNNKLLILHGDLGAAKNILKNIVMLSDDVYFPHTCFDRLQWMRENVYPPIAMDNWFKFEYSLKDYEKFGINMILGDASVDNIIHLSNDMRELLNKSNYAIDLFNKDRAIEVTQLPHTEFIIVHPTTHSGVMWQIRAYATKIMPENMHNFTYMDVNNIKKHIDVYGMHSWIKVNLYNFYQNVVRYIQQLNTTDLCHIPLEWILNQNDWGKVIQMLEFKFSISINHQKAFDLLDIWTNLHWKHTDTHNWEHCDIFDGYRTKHSDKIITTNAIV